VDGLTISIALLVGYILGSIPFGLLLAKAFGQGDIRQIGSGNIGATNVLRTGRKDLAITTLILDAGKAALAAILINYFYGLPYGLFAGAAALLGHCYSVWLGFKGGKGVATFFGSLLATAWPVGLCAAAIWLFTAFVSKLSSLGALVAALTAPLAAFIMGRSDVAFMAAFLALIIFIRHAENIRRIKAGTESKIGQKG
jgi:glycerol-3-phosphate acyltransferase PlsY